MTNQPSKGMARFNDWHLIILFAVLKIIIHLITYQNFELHRDAYLYYAQSEHLAWGYVAVPPFTAFIGKIATLLFGNTTFALRFFPALVGGINIIILGLAVKALEGKTKAIILTCLAYLLSPAYLHTNFLYQPVAFNHFFWLLFMFLAVKLVRKEDPKIWLWIGVVFGIGFLNKYSIIFVALAFALSLLISPKRKLYFSKYFLIGAATAAVIMLPNLIWQYQNNWPVLMHMEELRRLQLVHVQYSDFLIAQLLMNMQAIFLWVGAVIILLFWKKERNYQLFGLTYVFVLLIIMSGSGKDYYTLGIYPSLFVFGAVLFEKYVKRFSVLVMSVLILHMLLSLYISLSFDGVPFMTAEKIAKKEAFRWEDGKYYDIPQDIADMTGWVEVANSVIEIYQGLSPEDQAETEIYCGHYGQGGSIMFYGKKHSIPDPISPNGSFVFWAPEKIDPKYVIYVHSDLNNSFNADEELPKQFEKVTLMKTIDNPWFREDGTRLFLCENPHQSTIDYYEEMMKGLKGNYIRGIE